LSQIAAGVVTALAAAAQTTHPVATPKTATHTPPPPAARATVTRTVVGNASWYGPGFAGRRTASGEVFVPSRSTIASRHLPFGTRVRVTYLRTGKSAVAKVNDRGPFVRSRIVDLSEGLARKIGLKSAGHGKVKVEVLSRQTPPR
jgi:rare lipoprotein A